MTTWREEDHLRTGVDAKDNFWVGFWFGFIDRRKPKRV